MTHAKAAQDAKRLKTRTPSRLLREASPSVEVHRRENFFKRRQIVIVPGDENKVQRVAVLHPHVESARHFGSIPPRVFGAAIEFPAGDGDFRGWFDAKI